MRVGAAQLNPVVGDLDGNAHRAFAAYEDAAGQGCDLVVFPELMVTGYPPEDLLLKPAFVAAASETVAKFAARTGSMRGRHRVPRTSRPSVQRGRGVRARPGARRLPQTAPPQLRRVRRAALFRGVHR